jgi:hypothetical protein
MSAAGNSCLPWTVVVRSSPSYVHLLVSVPRILFIVTSSECPAKFIFSATIAVRSSSHSSWLPCWHLQVFAKATARLISSIAIVDPCALINIVGPHASPWRFPVTGITIEFRFKSSSHIFWHFPVTVITIESRFKSSSNISSSIQFILGSPT